MIYQEAANFVNKINDKVTSYIYQNEKTSIGIAFASVITGLAIPILLGLGLYWAGLNVYDSIKNTQVEMELEEYNFRVTQNTYKASLESFFNYVDEGMFITLRDLFQNTLDKKNEKDALDKLGAVKEGTGEVDKTNWFYSEELDRIESKYNAEQVRLREKLNTVYKVPYWEIDLLIADDKFGNTSLKSTLKELIKKFSYVKEELAYINHQISSGKTYDDQDKQSLDTKQNAIDRVLKDFNTLKTGIKSADSHNWCKQLFVNQSFQRHLDDALLKTS